MTRVDCGAGWNRSSSLGGYLGAQRRQQENFFAQAVSLSFLQRKKYFVFVIMVWLLERSFHTGGLEFRQAPRSQSVKHPEQK